MSGVSKGKYCYICKEFSRHPSLKDHQKTHENEIKNLRKSDNMRDAVLSACKICDKHVRVTDMRKHTKKAHDMTITKYKSRYSQQYFDLVELVLHQCGICGEFLMLDSDYIAQHIKSGGHNITHGNYNNLYIQLLGPRNTRPDIGPIMKDNVNNRNVPTTDVVADDRIMKRLSNCNNLIISRNSAPSEHLSMTSNSPERFENKTPADNLPPVRVTNDPNPVCVATFRDFLDNISENENKTLRFPALEALLGFNSDSPESIFQALAGIN